ncbi:MAG: DUF3299 domain-containing protein [Planctomycetota bacterium]|jgi:hypothetical protein
MVGRSLYYLCTAPAAPWLPASLASLALLGAAGCDGKPAPPTHRMVRGPVSGDLIAGAPVTASPATAAPQVPEPPPVRPATAVVEPPVVEPAPAGPGTPADPEPGKPAGPAVEAPIPPPDDGLPQPPKLPEAEKRKGYTSTSFDLLSGYEPGPLGVFGASPKILKNIKLSQFVPQRVLDLNEKKVGVTGYMIPVDFDKNEVLTFLLCRWQPGCCFGHVPKAHEQIYVEVEPGSGCRFVIVPVTAYGKLLIGPKKKADGTIITDGGEDLALYRMLADKIDVPKDW